jgi:hypothetical protein
LIWSISLFMKPSPSPIKERHRVRYGILGFHTKRSPAFGG